VTAYVGKLVEQELRRHSRTNLAEIPADAPPRDEAIAAFAPTSLRAPTGVRPADSLTTGRD
jgi:hypothetical protein